jgi:hypothetical protein
MIMRFRSLPLVALVCLLAPQNALADAVTAQPRDTVISTATANVAAERLHDTVAKLVSFGTRNSFSEKLGSTRGVFAARAWIAAQLREIAKASNGRMTVSYDSYVQQPDGKRIVRPVEISSVIAELRGDEPGGRTYVISSHYDSRNSSNEDIIVDAPGADDNASGTAVVLEAARALAAVPTHATIIFAIYDSEEQGLLGSGHHAQTLKAAGRDVQGDLNNDIVGASRGDHGEVNSDFVRIFSESLPLGSVPSRVNLLGNESDSPSRELARYAKDVGDTYGAGFSGRLVFRADRFLRGGDHESFNAVGFPAIRFVEPVETFAHQHQNPRVENGIQYGDFIDYMDFNYLAQVARYNIAVVATLARGPGLPRDAAVLTKELTNDTSLSWSAVPGAVGYEIVRRLSTEPVWTQCDAVGNVTHVTLPYSKDNWIFGIRAVDGFGHRGVAASPTPKSK